ncbi:MAG: M50 family metallopeptidase [Bulleidia sp.]
MRDDKKKGIFVGLYYVLCVIGGIAVGFLMTQFYFSQGLIHGRLSLATVILRIALLVVALYLQLFLHEAGHLVFGLLSGYSFLSFRIFDWMIVNDHGHLLLRRIHLDGTAGQCLMIPPEPVDGHVPGLLYNLGGVLMNFIVSAVCAVLLLVIPFGTDLRMFLFEIILFGVVFGLTNGIPLMAGTVVNDGANAVALEKSPQANRAFYLQLKMNAMLTEGVSLSGMPDEWFAIPDDEDMKNPLIATIGVFACNRMMEQHRFTDMETQITHFMNITTGMNSIHRQLLKCDLLYVRLLAGKSGEPVDSLLTKDVKKVMKTMKNYPSVIRTNYAYALLHDQDQDKADEYSHQLAHIAPSYPYQTDVMHETDLMLLAKEQYKRMKEA